MRPPACLECARLRRLLDRRDEYHATLLEAIGRLEAERGALSGECLELQATVAFVTSAAGWLLAAAVRARAAYIATAAAWTRLREAVVRALS